MAGGCPPSGWIRCLPHALICSTLTQSSLTFPLLDCSCCQACIDQSDIAANLACLPVFLSGCKELLCLAGGTYVTRLWCVMELFTFVQMGGERTALSVVELGDSVRGALSRFDASKARCFLSKDRQHLLAVMEAGFGDLQPFNRVMRQLLKERTVDIQARPWALRRFVSSRKASRVLPNARGE